MSIIFSPLSARGREGGGEPLQDLYYRIYCVDRAKYDSRSRSSRAIFTTSRPLKCIETIQIKQRVRTRCGWKRGGGPRDLAKKPARLPSLPRFFTEGGAPLFPSFAPIFFPFFPLDDSLPIDRGRAALHLSRPLSRPFSHERSCGNRSRSLHPVQPMSTTWKRHPTKNRPPSANTPRPAAPVRAKVARYERVGEYR